MVSIRQLHVESKKGQICMNRGHGRCQGRRSREIETVSKGINWRLEGK